MTPRPRDDGSEACSARCGLVDAARRKIQSFIACRAGKGVNMSQGVRKVDYFHVMVPNKPGRGAQVLAGLAAERVNLLAFSGFPNGSKGQLDLIPESSAALRRAARKLGLDLSARKTGFLVQGADRVGAMTKLLDTLAAAKINVTAMDAVTAGAGRYGAIFWVKPKSVAKAARLLRAR